MYVCMYVLVYYVISYLIKYHDDSAYFQTNDLKVLLS